MEALADVVEILGRYRHVVIAREVTKLHEEFLRGRAGEVLETLKARDGVKGEITLLIGKTEESQMMEKAAAPVPPFARGLSRSWQRRKSGRKGGTEESGQGAGDFEERGLQGVAEK